MLTPRQRQTYDFICKFIHKYGYSPTLQEIAAELGVAGNLGVLRHLEALVRSGMIHRTPGLSRAITINEQPVARRGLPLIGRIQAGTPQLAQQERGREVVVDPSLISSPDSFVLRVQGDSMIDAQICSGDLVIIRPQPTAENGEIIVAMIDGEATLKRFYREKGRIRLQPENSSMEPIFLEEGGDEIVIIGKVTGLLRKF